MWMVGGLTALDVAVADVFYLKISSIREEPQTEVGWVRDKVGSLGNQVTRIKAILDERLSRGD